MIVLGFLLLMTICVCFIGAPIAAILVTLVIAFGVRGIMLGYDQRNVFYHDKRDVIVNALVTIIFGLGGLGLLGQIIYEHGNWPGYLISLILIFIPILYSFEKTAPYSKNRFDIFCLLCGRFVMGFSSVLFLLGVSSLYGDSRPNKVTQTASESLVGLITMVGILSGYVVLTQKLINKVSIKEQVG